MKIPFHITKQERVPFFIGEKFVRYGELKGYIFNVVYKEGDHFRWAVFCEKDGIIRRAEKFADVGEATRHLMDIHCIGVLLSRISSSHISVVDITDKSEKMAITEVTTNKRILKRYNRFLLTETKKDVVPRVMYRHVIAIDYEKSNKEYDTFARGIAKSHIYVKRNPGSTVAINNYLLMNRNNTINLTSADKLEEMV